MKRLTLLLLSFSLPATMAMAASAPPPSVETLQDRIAKLEARVKQLEVELAQARGTKSPPVAEAASTGVQPKQPPAQPEQPTKTTRKTSRAYVIKEGDTITEIAHKNGISRAELMAENKIREGQQIYIGDELMVPVIEEVKEAPPSPATKLADKKTTTKPSASPTPSKPAPAPAPAKPEDSVKYYTIKYGDTLSSIARKHGVTVAQLKAANGMTSDRISGGQRLKLPVDGATASLARNDSTPPKPAPEKKETASATNSPAKPESSSGDKPLLDGETYGLYTVERGDTLYSLARDFFTSQQEIQRLNELGKSTMLRPGQDLVVPTSKYFEHHKLANR